MPFQCSTVRQCFARDGVMPVRKGAVCFNLLHGNYLGSCHVDAQRPASSPVCTLTNCKLVLLANCLVIEVKQGGEQHFS